MLKVPVYNVKGEKIGEEKLNPEVFDIKVKNEVVHRVVEAYLSNLRNTVASAKERGEVRGGGRKPWKQKGTGRARAGSIRSPIWKGGGVTFGPTSERNFKKKINKNEKRKALFMALSAKANDKKIVIVDNIKIEKIKTKEILKILNKLPMPNLNALIALPKKDSIVSKSAGNLPKVEVVLANSLNAYNVLRYEFILLTKDSIKEIEKLI